jgi:hypothetical protein
VRTETEKKRDASRGSSGSRGSSSSGRESGMSMSSVLLPCRFWF